MRDAFKNKIIFYDLGLQDSEVVFTIITVAKLHSDPEIFK